MNETNETIVREETNGEVEIDLRELFFILRQKLLTIVAAVVLGGVIAGLATYYLIAPTYEATAKLYIVSASSNSVVNLSDLQIGTSLTQDYADLVTSRPVLESVIRNLKLEGVSVGTLRSWITINNPSQTRILWITATTQDPALSAQIANEMANVSVSWLPHVMECNKPNIAEEAIKPAGRVGPSYTRNAAIGALALGIVVYGIYVLRYILNDSIRTAADMERYFGVVPLAAIPEDEGVEGGQTGRKGPKRKAKRAQGGR